MGFLDSGVDKSPAPPPVSEIPKESDAEVKAAALAERRRLQLMRGRSSTILTSGGLGEASIGRKTLLGGGG